MFVLVPVVALLGLGGYLHWRTYADAAETKQEQEDFVPQVRTAVAQKVDTPVDLTLPGQTEAFDAANLYPRATGYIAERRVDIGSRVHKDDLLVRIDAPDLDQQLAQAQAQLGQNQAAVLQAQAQVQSAQANTKLADVTKYRETTLAGQGWETKQNADNATANFSVQTAGIANAEAGVAVALANLKAQQATVDRLQALTAFEQVKAPFDGVITARNVDTGDLLTQDSLGGNPMFSIVRDDVLRIVGLCAAEQCHRHPRWGGGAGDRAGNAGARSSRGVSLAVPWRCRRRRARCGPRWMCPIRTTCCGRDCS